MATVTYNHKSIEALPSPTPPRRQQEYGVKEKPGLLVVVGLGGAKAWYLRYQLNHRRRKMKLGDFPETGLKEASNAA
ncbi:MAG: DUF4102 domain-containing protein, partial [Armatimonadetes bacterium]|nr:DUF4102 domain-containing protein [Armatimonadota bacterium]